jgi:hypothetical protein
MGEIESLIIEAQDQALSTCYHQWNIMQQPIDSKCRMCSKAEEHIKHIVVGCTIFAPCEYTNTHNKVAGYIHWMICKHTGLQVTDMYLENIPDWVINVNSTTICGMYWLSQTEQYCMIKWSRLAY